MKLIVLFILLASCHALSQTYSRTEWGSWIDTDKDCQNTRQEVLIDESVIPVVLDAGGCKVLSGLWICIYTGAIITDPTELDVDHLVPLENANKSGGYSWPNTKKKTYANYLENKFHLIAVSKSANRSKGAKSPDQWIPSYKASQCAYLKLWVEIKEYWGLEFTSDENIFIDHFSEVNCN